MRTKPTSIPVNSMTDEAGLGIAVERLSFADARAIELAVGGGMAEARQAHREDSHSFFLLESGLVRVEIDFQEYEVGPQTVVYMHPAQVHRIVAFEQVTVSSLAISTENLAPAYLALLEGLVPAGPLPLSPEVFALIMEAAALCVKLAARRTDRLYQAQLKDGCNALVGLIISQYLARARPQASLSRREAVTKAFRELLERQYAEQKRPAAYAQQLHVSTAYLNECVKSTTGQSVSYHIQQRVLLEAKRLLYHSDKSVKEIAAVLGYDDYPYFARLFAKAVGMTALAFRGARRE